MVQVHQAAQYAVPEMDDIRSYDDHRHFLVIAEAALVPFPFSRSRNYVIGGSKLGDERGAPRTSQGTTPLFHHKYTRFRHSIANILQPSFLCLVYLAHFTSYNTRVL